jgi:hypothetical protein
MSGDDTIIDGIGERHDLADPNVRVMLDELRDGLNAASRHRP